MAIYFAQNKTKLFLGPQKVRQGYVADRKVYSSANTVTYMVDTGISYTEEADSGTSCLSPKTFTPQKTGWSFVGWREDRTASAGVLESKVMADSPVTLYAVFRAGVTVTYYNNSTSASSTSGYRYYNNGSVVNPSFQLTQASSSGWTARGWSISNQGNAGITYTNGAVFTRDSNVTLYGLYQQSITVTYYNNSTSASRTIGTRYWAPAGYINPSFQLTQASSGGWTARGWSTGTAGNSGITYNNGAAFTRDSSITLYGMYQQTITLSYNGNGASGGSTATQSGTRYYNSNGATVNPSFTLRANGFSRSGCTFKKWALGGAGGTQYAPGAGITLSASAAMYAVWTGIQTVITLSKNGVYVDGTTWIEIKPDRMLIYDAGIDCSLFRGVQFKSVQIYVETRHEMTGATFGMYESAGGAFMPLVNFWKDAGSVGGAQGTEYLVKNGEIATFYFAKASGITKLYVGFRHYRGESAPYGNAFFNFADVTLIPR
ncbi:MAG: InlB B-repeat-containing protein [Acetatifactor sp.]|nr:InlB B-repeat-containing protein [Acetatifactor sp.]